MRRRQFIAKGAAMATILAGSSLSTASKLSGPESGRGPFASLDVKKLIPPREGTIPVAFAISDRATVIDFCGPWEVFQDVMIENPNKKDDLIQAFNLFTISEKTDPLRASAGLQIVPDFTFDNAPAAKVVVVPAQRGSSALYEWLRKIAEKTDVTMSVCTGAFQLGRAGLLSGKSATTHHDFFDRFAKAFPNVELKRGVRFVEGDRISTAGGLTSGIDLALHVVERYFGRLVAQRTAEYMEYQSKAWMV